MTAPNSGLETTFRVLHDIASPWAGQVLTAALDSPLPAVVEQAIRGLVTRREPAGRRAVLQRWEGLDPRWKALLREYPGQMEGAIRDAVSSDEMAACARGCNAAVYLEEYNILPTLLTVLTNQVTPTSDTIAATTLQLVDRLGKELDAPRSGSEGRRRDPQAMREHVIDSLAAAVQRFSQHRRREVVEAFLALAQPDNRVLRHILHDPHHGSFVAVIDVLQKSHRSHVTRLLCELLLQPQAPSAALNVVGHRSDLRFLRHFLRSIGREPDAAVRGNLKRIVGLAWLKNLAAYLPELDEHAQEGLCRLAQHSGISRDEAFTVIESLLQQGKTGVRRTAAAALAEFKGNDANQLAISSLQDPDPEVQATLVLQLRSRGIGGLFPRLVELLDSPHLGVRQAARQNLDEFDFKHYLSSFDVLDDQTRVRTGALVKKVDPETLPLLEAELTSNVRSRQLRAFRIALALEVVEAAEGAILPLLSHNDVRLRMDAATTLAASASPASQAALRQALGDPNLSVQEAAQRSLDARSPDAAWPPTITAPPSGADLQPSPASL